MERFSIPCTTCKARLLVKDASAIGAILACPKCGSMVQVVPPVGWPMAAETSAGSLDKVSEPQSVTQSPAGPAVSRASGATPPPLPAKASLRPAGSLAGEPAAEPVVATESAASVESAVTLPGVWSAIEARLARDWPLLAGGAAAGVLIGVAAWFILGTSSGPTPPVLAAVDNAATLAPAPAADPRSPEPVDSRPAASIDIVPTDPGIDASEEAPLASTSEVATGTSMATKLPPTTSSEVVAMPQVEAISESEPTKALKLEPVAEANETAGEPDPLAELPSRAAEEVAADDEPLGVEQVEPAEEPTTPGRILSRSEVEERLALRIPQVRFAQVPLVQFVDFIASFTSLPIAIDDRSLATIGKARDLKVNVNLRDTTASGALRSALKPHGLTCRVAGDKIVVAAQSSTNSAD